MKKNNLLLLISIVLILGGSCKENYSNEQEKHIEIFKKYTKYDFPAISTIIDSFYAGFLDYTYYMVVKTDELYIDKIMKLPPPFTDTWLDGPVPEKLRYGIYFGKNKNISSYGKGKSYGHEELIKLLDSKEIIYSINGSMLEYPYELNVFIIDKKENIIYIGLYSM